MLVTTLMRANRIPGRDVHRRGVVHAVLRSEVDCGGTTVRDETDQPSDAGRYLRGFEDVARMPPRHVAWRAGASPPETVTPFADGSARVPESSTAPTHPPTDAPEVRMAKFIDHGRCIGCHACTTACKSENEVPVGVTRTYVKHVESGTFPNTRRNFQVTRCNQCADPPCVAACPVTAMYQRPDGIVDFDKDVCIGCKACIAACPYDAIFINPDDGSAEKCNFCAHKVDRGLEPACVTVCPAEAILIGDLNDPTSKVAHLAGSASAQVRRPEKETHPKLFYLGVDRSTLDPLAATNAGGGIFQWSEQPSGPHDVPSGAPLGWEANNAAASLLGYDVKHTRPWDWRVGLYTWTKSVSAGAFLVAVLGALLGFLPFDGTLVQWTAPLLGGVFLAATGLILIFDLTHPERFYTILLRPQWRSWLARGAFIIAGYGALLVLWLAGSLFGGETLQRAVGWLAVPTALMTAVYTAFLFAQSKGRDLWQNPLLPTHMGVQAILAGAATLGVAAAITGDGAAIRFTLPVLTGSLLLHGLMVGGELALPTVTAHARLAEHHLVRGQFATWFWSGVVGGVVLPLLILALSFSAAGLALAAIAALAGLAAFEHAYVQAGQSVPLA